ncbi:DNA recombination protein RmuC [Collinsella tanakaei]|nr:DNA recombination protein RmuC [Collinsella tanakaei]MDM8300406.1 DNA recombination protein RmuC [Collinsella tanakaei]
MDTGILIGVAALAAVCVLLSAVCVVLVVRLSREVREGRERADASTRDAERLAAALDELAATGARADASLAALLQRAASDAAVDAERFDVVAREFNRSVVRMDALRREVQNQLGQNRDVMEAKIGEVRTTVDQQLGLIREDNERQLERMRLTVDEKLQATLENRLARSFKQVSDQLEAVYRGLGDMQGIAAGVGDLKRVLANVKTRGMLGEVQLGAILADILAPEQYARNVATRPGSAERVEFAVKIPVEGADPVWLPIDAKFPGDTYEHLRGAMEAGDTDRLAAARKQLEQRIKLEAKDISTKYISVPETTNFAIMFLPFEGLYAEVVDTPGLIESLQRDYQVSVAGPSTMAAILNSLQMSYQSFAFQRRADEIQRVLSAVKAELPRYQAALQKAYDQINRAGSTVESIMTTRTRAIERKLRSVTAMEDEREAARVFEDDESVPVAVEVEVDEQDAPGEADA